MLLPGAIDIPSLKDHPLGTDAYLPTPPLCNAPTAPLGVRSTMYGAPRYKRDLAMLLPLSHAMSGTSLGYGATILGYGSTDCGYGATDCGYGTTDCGYGATAILLLPYYY
eukprot:690676-Rhodomonas_salina.2